MDLWEAIREERTSVLDVCASLTDAQWETPSLCGKWTVRQVLGHLVIAADAPMGRFAVELAKSFGRFDVAQDALARAEAKRPTAELLACYRELVDRRATPPGFGPEAPLSDILLHSLDVRIPLGLPLDGSPERYVVPLDLLFVRRAALAFVPRGRPALRWVATDHPWTHGDGDEVRATMMDLTLAASGRGVHIDAVTGPGQPALAAWLRR